MNCSILIPSRKRFDKLKRCIQSFFDTANPDNFEIVVRFSSDDGDSVARKDELKGFGPNVLCFVDKPLRGYQDLNVYYSQLSDSSRGDWVWIFNDDAYVRGAGWDKLLKDIPTEGFIVHPQFQQLNTSTYERVDAGPFPIVPLYSWKRFGYDVIPGPVDLALDDILRKHNGWKSRFLTGITVVHERGTDEQLEKERAT